MGQDRIKARSLGSLSPEIQTDPLPRERGSFRRLIHGWFAAWGNFEPGQRIRDGVPRRFRRDENVASRQCLEIAINCANGDDGEFRFIEAPDK
jgi:hypothetical protein